MNTESQQNLDTDNTAETDSAAQTEKAACTSSKIQILRENSIYLLPNSFTIAALFCAFYAITQSMHGRFESAAISVFYAMILDGMDGRVARLTKSQSAFGEQLDSLADMVSFGVSPALIVYNWHLYQFGKLGYCVAFVYCACAALRLALFNTLIGKVDKKWFIGIPSPTAAALIASVVWLDYGYNGLFDHASVWVILLTLFAGLSMVAQVKFWSFKEIRPNLKVPFMGMIGLLLFLMLFVLDPALVLFVFFFVYSLSGYVVWLRQKWKCCQAK
ncbi:CDP-diacylglycerol--serine O-phosphatidyltransferase [Kingella kingae]|uniref:CDP-diacylglycerol--serine O-phosphatidyltransferase n=1 Tax=Kingella kingae TaxID=504 RepID=UPI00040516D7|nr:CDP-diacylglycerol--serine O-phosphatidyltransferase [Kingella kingae]MDK4545704.1 CDP-diacylglycerol--serine O-phosphatidyltransferase [Kingella kingae]MDK4567629.1 CDP-diacylglycerol--serine O-phosphatidyltransferase [Kingella kingae]MDK4625171.1 CDP-diacylglycerol--serine O-phosphatidyltransferase [Kingella kingae]MDK4628898.1 CDP-diacylglycerol--serine O-phosphatidyltransferase [Kingella kingae]MDK4637355.1 CDP-diacylglycerol--serine O-phosphatidyltransferase [Kingella kingae]